ncbi:unnamed protein product [Polarella glacialis]|uniref:Exoribonuclease phosphorolytic domain-containing protein n=1 Tax=Polarella glacialis TaxID=89957 RepID=A0A813K7I5_POLGL|nr:unnamed protein product [Polarella glacialis]CAE8695997.1 unnamed protein product [Polarella glacialis]
MSLGDPPPAIERPEGGFAQSSSAVTYVPRPARRPALSAARPSGRRAEETRSCNLRVGAVPNAAGSAYIEQGNTKIIASVYGPRQAVERGAQGGAEGLLLLDLQFAPFSSRASREENEKRGVLYTGMLQTALESVVLLDRYAKTAFDVTLLVLEDDGAVLTAGLAAASLALADAKVEMRDLVAGASVHLVAAGASGPGPVSGTILLDCDGQEEKELPEGSAVLHLGLCPSRGVLCLLHSAGPLPAGPFEQMVLLAKDTAEAVGAEMRSCLERRVENRVAKRARLGTSPADSAGLAADVVMDTSATPVDDGYE